MLFSFDMSQPYNIIIAFDGYEIRLALLVIVSVTLASLVVLSLLEAINNGR